MQHMFIVKQALYQVLNNSQYLDLKLEGLSIKIVQKAHKNCSLWPHPLECMSFSLFLMYINFFFGDFIDTSQIYYFFIRP